MIKRNGLILIAMLFAGLAATESRVESMGKRDLFFRDDMSIFYNPANVGVLGSFVTGSLGLVNDARDIAYSIKNITRDTNGTITSWDVDSQVVRKTATPTNQWFGVVYNFPINDKAGIFAGAAFNRSDEYLDLYEKLGPKKKYSSTQNFPSLKGKSDYMLGAKFSNINVGVGYYSASQHEVVQDSIHDVAIDLSRINIGTEIGIGSHSLEAYFGLGSITYANTGTQDKVYKITEKTDNSTFAGARFFYQTSLGGGLVFVPAIKFSSLKLFDSTETRISGGIGLNYRLDGGLFWAGVEAESFSSEDSLTETSGGGARFNFGIEKSLIFKWLTVRVGGMKFIGSQDIKPKAGGETTSEWIENSVDNGTSDDFLGFGIGLNYQNRLRFDITLNESMPYFNPFGNGLQNSSNGGHMLLRISSTFSL